MHKRKNEHPTKVECSFLVDVRSRPSASLRLHTYGLSTQDFVFGTRLHRSELKNLPLATFFCVQTLSSSILQKRKNEHPTKVECSFLVDVRRIELLSKNLFIPVSPSADISLHSLLQPSNVGLL